MIASRKGCQTLTDLIKGKTDILQRTGHSRMSVLQISFSYVGVYM